MAYITREDGERFIIPSYRDVISAKKSSLLKRELLLLSQNYGEYVNLHKKNAEQYEVAFSTEPGYLLGESIWNYFKRPLDLIYCEQIGNTTEAILVIVKSGSVYLDGSFPIDSIPEELVVFRTQQNNFDIYLSGEIPISQTPEPGKFSFDPASVRSFNILPEPIFQKFPKVKAFQLQLVDTVLAAQGIGVLPLKQIAIALGVFFVIYFIWDYLSTHKKALPTAIVGVYNPYQVYFDTLTSPDPVREIYRVYTSINLLYTIPGWVPISLDYSKGKMSVLVRSNGADTKLLFSWAAKNAAAVVVQSDGFYLTWNINQPFRSTPTTIYQLSDVIGSIIDRLHTVAPQQELQISNIMDRRSYKEMTLTVNFSSITPDVFYLIGLQFKNLPLVLTKVSMGMDNGNLSGSIVLQVLGD